MLCFASENVTLRKVGEQRGREEQESRAEEQSGRTERESKEGEQSGRAVQMCRAIKQIRKSVPKRRNKVFMD